MKTVAIIPCTNQKTDTPGPARYVWKGHHFQLTLAHAERYYSDVLILSYKYGLIGPDFEIEPYDIDLRSSSDVRAKLEWWWLVRDHIDELCTATPGPDLIGLYTGTFERDRIIREFVKHGVDKIITPWEGLSIGKRMQAVYDDMPPFKEELIPTDKYKVVLDSAKKTVPQVNADEIEWVE